MVSLSNHLAAEEPEITSIAIMPGTVDTDMQRVLREEGKAVMAEKDYAGFVEAFEGGQLFRPDEPGHVIARFVVDPQEALSGKHLKYASQSNLPETDANCRRFQAPELAAYRD